MRVLLERKYAKFLDAEKKTISYEEFFQNFIIKQNITSENLQIIVDRPDAFEFSVDRLRKSTIFDVYDHLRCQKQILSKNEEAFWQQGNSFMRNFWKEKEYKIQKVTLTDDNLLKIAENFDGIIPLEFLILNFCKKIEHLEESAWWLYIAYHSRNEIRIVAGQGCCLLLSRSVNFSEDLKQTLRELRNSLRFLRRFGLKNDVKIITPIKNIELYEQKISPMDLQKICENSGLPIVSDIEDCILNFSHNLRKKRRIFGGKINLKKYFSENFEKFTIVTGCVLTILIIYLTYLLLNISLLKNEVMFLKNNEIVQNCSSMNFDLAVDDESFGFARNLFKNFQRSKNPIIALDKVSEFVDENKIYVENFNLKNLQTAELRTKLDRKKAEKLKKFHKKVEVKIIENQNIGGYEELNNKSVDNEQGANICLKIE